MSLSIEPCSVCNLQCRECPSGNGNLKRQKGFMDLALFNKIIEENYRKLSYIILYFQGEPFLNPVFFDMIESSVAKNIYTISSTNGHFLDRQNSEKTVKSGLDKLIISLDGADQKSYSEYRKGGDFQTVVKGISELTEARKKLKSKTPFIELQFLVSRYNEHQIEDIKKLSTGLHCDKLTFKSLQINDLTKCSDLLPLNQKYSRYLKNDDGTFRIKNKLKNKCWRMWSSAVVTIEGNVVPCCFDKDANYTMGSVTEKSLKEIWNNDLYSNFRKKILSSRSETDICRNCTEGIF
jgi:radical SAM protein with 4Fe4S-binding SPASM domain